MSLLSAHCACGDPVALGQNKCAVCISLTARIPHADRAIKKSLQARTRPIAPARRPNRPKLAGFKPHELAWACEIASQMGGNESFKAAMKEAATHFEAMAKEKGVGGGER